MKGKGTVTLKVEPGGLKLEGRIGSTILSILNESGVKIRSECGGKQVCGKCKIILHTFEVGNEVSEAESLHLNEEEIKSGYRLACACKIYGDATITIPEESRIGVRSVLVEGVERPVKVEPAVKKFFLIVDKPTLEDTRSDLWRIEDLLSEIYKIKDVKIDPQQLRVLPKILRESEWKITLTLWDKEIIHVEPSKVKDIYGVAIDIGTSKIIGYLSDLTTGELIGTSFIENPQISYGEDVISRVTFASQNNDNLWKMHRVLIDGINRIINKLIERWRINPNHIYEVTVVGNTAMHHFFLGLTPKYLGLSPYVPVINEPLNLKASFLSIKMNTAGNIHVLPVIAGFVGSDAVADIISTGIHQSNDISMLVDIGTNTEVILKSGDRITACSCASGPAFEGAHIKCGMKAVEGAIERISIDDLTMKPTIKTVRDSSPIGICGSAVIDGIAELFRLGIINKKGRITKPEKGNRVREVDGEREFLILAKGELGAKRDIVITQKDVREIQLAKSAIYTGCCILMKRLGVKPSEIQRFYIAGAFGNYLNPENAKLIGMVPDIPTERMIFVGNAAGAGARMALISKRVRNEAIEVARKVEYLELALDPDFQMEFASATYFPHRDIERFPSIKAKYHH